MDRRTVLKLLGCNLIIFNFFLVAGAADVCPHRCICIRNSVRCIRVNMTSVPRVSDNIRDLDLRFNEIRDLPPGSFGNLRELKTLLLSDNRLTLLRAGAFAGLRNLTRLYLYRNRIHQIDPEAFHGLDRLQYLYIHMNKIETFWPATFSNLQKLERLFLYKNKIKSVSEGSLPLTSLRRLRLDGNPIVCDCSALWLVRLASEWRSLVVDATCNAPAKLAGITVHSVDPRWLQCGMPVIVQEPQDATVEYGREASLTCRATGDPAPEVIWVRDSSALGSGDGRYVMLDNGTLRIVRTDMSDDGVFECIAVNPVGKAKSRPARMIVSKEEPKFESPAFSVIPRNAVVRRGDSLALHCSATGKPRPHLLWYRNHTRMLLTERVTLSHNGTLLIEDTTHADEGLYTCHGVNTHGKISASATVKIVSAPRFLIIPETKTAAIGERVNIICKAHGTPLPIITWYKDDQTLTPAANIAFGQESTVLMIGRIADKDEGSYVCRAENTEGFIETSFNINIESESFKPPKLIEKPYNVEATTGSAVEIPCRSSGQPTPRIEWRKDGNSILYDSHKKISSIGSLLIYNITTADAGRYECSVVNEFGRDTASGVLSILATNLPGDKFVKSAFNQAVEDIDLAIQNTIDALLNKKGHVDPFRTVRYPNDEARAVARPAEIYERTLVLIRKKVDEGMKVNMSSSFSYRDILSAQQLDLIAQLSGCTAHRQARDCSDVCFHNKYRNIDGSCNNLKYTTWGASLTGFRRLLPPIYENGISHPVGWSKDVRYNGYTLPNARKISTELISTNEITEDKRITHMVMQWGQFLDHDLDHALPSVSSQSWDGIDCKKSCDYAAPCFPMDVPPNDPRITNRRCIDFIRTSAVCGSGMTSVFFNEIQPREQINQLTSYIDGSQIYGYASELAKDLRDLSNDEGLLRVGPTLPGKKPLLPFAGNQGIDCRRDPLESNINCFLAGDIRVNEQIGLTAMHTIWLREHNRLAKGLRAVNPFWDGNTIYQEARKIVGAMIQFITYEHWLPIILGPEGMKQLGNYNQYNPKLNPSISNVFATAALRFGHTLINPILHRYDQNFETIPEGHLELHKAFFAPWRVVEEGGVDPLLRGMFMTPAKVKTPTQNLNDELTEKLFHTAHAVALDLASMNIQRARDHAIPPYLEWRKFCNLTDVIDFDDLNGEISNEQVRNKLETLYGSPRNIDVFVGGILEDQVEGGKVGPLFRCILIDQFKRLRDGDRFWYESPTTFKPEQLQQIKETSVARLLCDNGDNIDTIAENVFLLPEYQDGLLDCEDVSAMDLRPWADCHECNNEVGDAVRAKRSIIEESPVKQYSMSMGQMDKTYHDFKEKMETLEKRITFLEEQCPHPT